MAMSCCLVDKPDGLDLDDPCTSCPLARDELELRCGAGCGPGRWLEEIC